MSKVSIDRQVSTQDKNDVHYRQHESCLTCAFFNGRILCSKVVGHISPEAVCDLWSMIEEPKRVTGKQMIMQAWEKARR